ncbi:sugar-binding domain-containing protein [Gleimia hominis]|uniref:Sugar-binding domain-containing protein n=2 Tax=Gleimia hominis TaxID=595468 RepID=A0ABU3IDI1_9ACTO|nr:sugar-binding domain-containing protein [Gleimia hominis]MDT3768021.1 sugar-binding domain-containing protein [Gleimia hominis]
MSIRDTQAHEAASMYYLQGQTMENIARYLQMSRSSVSRLLAYARESGLVQITVAASPGERGTLAGELNNLFNIRSTVVRVRTHDTGVNRLDNVARVAAERLMDILKPGCTLGIAWGNTTAEVTRHLPNKDIPGTTVVQLNGAASAMGTGVRYIDSTISHAAEAIGADMIHFPVPAFFDYEDTKRALWRERSVMAVLDRIEKTDVAMFGVGAFGGEVPSHVYSAGYLDEAELQAARRAGVVGDVCTVLIREDGTYADMDINRRASGPSPQTLRRIPRRLCVVAGEAKAIPLIGALKAGVVTDLVVDDHTARRVLERVATR